MTWTIAAWTQATDCTYTETLSMTPTAAWITLDAAARTVTISTTDKSLHTTTAVTFTVVTTLDDAAGPTASDSTNSYVFSVVLTDECKTATLTAPTIAAITTSWDDTGAI